MGFDTGVPDLISKAEAEAGTSVTERIFSALRVKQAIAALAPSGGSGNTFARVVKKVDETVNNSSTLQDDDELFVALSASKVYSYMLTLELSSGVTPDFKWLFTLPTDATGRYAEGNLSSTAAVGFSDVTNSKFLPGSSVSLVILIIGRIIMGTTAGNVQLQWAQNTADASDTKVLQGASLVIWEETA